MKNQLAVRMTVLVTAFILAFVLSITSSMPLGAVDVPGAARSYFKVFWPQGWAFFTKDAKSPTFRVFRKNSANEWAFDDIGRNGEIKYLFGWIRKNRARMIEVAFLLSFARDDIKVCRRAPAVCLAEAEKSNLIRLENPTGTPLVCGRVGIVQQDPLPWAWLEAEAKTHMHSRIAVMEVTCNEST